MNMDNGHHRGSKIKLFIQHSFPILTGYKIIHAALISQQNPFDGDYPYSFNDLFSRVLNHQLNRPVPPDYMQYDLLVM